MRARKTIIRKVKIAKVCTTSVITKVQNAMHKTNTQCNKINLDVSSNSSNMMV